MNDDRDAKVPPADCPVDANAQPPHRLDAPAGADANVAARRRFLKAGLAGGAALGGSVVANAAQASGGALGGSPAAVPDPEQGKRPFYGAHQGGIGDPQQKFSYVAAFDLTTTARADVIALLQGWTLAAARLTQGLTAKPLSLADDQTADSTTPPDSGEALGLGANELTITFGFGPGLFEKDGKDRYGLAARRPAALVDLPRFNGDQLLPAKTGGDLLIQACANDPQVAFHAVRALSRIAYGHAQMRWGQAGFLSGPRGATPRNLMGFKDGTSNPSIRSPEQMNRYVWADDSDADWMNGGAYTVVRRIRITIEHWDQMERGFQEQVFGREKYSGAPLGKQHEFDDIDLNQADKDGNPLIPESAHIRLSHESQNNGAQILRRSYSYNDSTDFYIERWPPWRQETEFDAGLIFIAHQRDPRKGFIPINEKLSKFDMLNQFATHVGSGIFACPPGAREGSYIGASLFEA
ncbi:iron uptake transporter deferrochelatase/peroxidase subunit [Robbsia sp. KACC 23696]|uniref:iron uptake transporter deferrochelatase/peroxidase subunit n=1 Tax=Robbsia sp. KACC 23696 TaxID=3149231 RepID=UPI00325C287D